MTVTLNFHNAFICSIALYAEKSDVNIYDLIRKLISDMNWLLSPGGIEFEELSPGKALKKHFKKNCGYFTFCNQPPHKKGNIIDWFVYLDKSKEWEAWEDITWFDILTYLLFIQTNCHHKGHILGSKLCKNSDSFKDFFYKSKNIFIYDENKNLKRVNNKKLDSLAPWWVSTFYKEKKALLMFNDLSSDRYFNINKRDTTGWIARGYDWLPFGSVINRLRYINGLPFLSGDYGLGHLSEKQINKEVRFIIKQDNIDTTDKQELPFNYKYDNPKINYNILMVQCFIGSFSFGLWFSKFIKK